MKLSYTVVIPAYNAARTLSETLESVLLQTLPPLEVIVVDDGSTDATATVAQRFGGVRVITQANSGPGSASNAGVALATGDVLAFLDADDLWVPDAMEEQIDALVHGTKSDAVVGDMEEFVCPSEPPEYAARFVPRTRQTGWISGATAVRAASFQQVGAFAALRSGHWLDWMDRARRAGIVFTHSNELVLRRRLHRSSLSMHARRGRTLLAAAREAIKRRKNDAPISEERTDKNDKLQT